MLKTIFKYTFKTLFRRKKIFIGAITTIALCVALCVMIVSITHSISTSYDDYITKNYGKYTGLLSINSLDQSKELSLSDDTVGFIYNLGGIKSEKSVYDKQLSIGYISSMENKENHINLLDGYLPEKHNEIVVEKSLSEKLLINLSLNDYVTLKVNDHENNEFEETFKVVGIIDDYATLPEMKIDDLSIWPSILVSEHYIQKYNSTLNYAIVSNVSTENLLGSADKFESTAYINPIYNENSILYNIDISTNIILTILLVCGLLVTVISIYAYLMISDNELTEHYKNLKLIGADKKGIVIYTLFRMMIIYFSSLLIGVFMGLVGSYVFGNAIIKKFIDVYSYKFDVWGVLFGIIIPLIVLVITTIFRMATVLNKRPLQVSMVQTNHKVRKLAIKDILKKWSLIGILNRKNTYIGLSFAMSFCFFAVFIGVMFNFTIRDEYEKEYNDNYSIRVYDGNFATSFEMPIRPYYGVSENTINELSKSTEIESISTIKALTAIVEEPSNDIKYKQFFNESARQLSIEKEDFEFITESFDLNRESEYYKTLVFEVDDRLLNLLLESENIYGNATCEELKTGEEIIIICNNINACPYKPGDQISLFQALSRNANYFSIDDCDVFDTTVSIAAIVQIDERESYLGEKFFTYNGMQCVWGTGSFEKNKVSLNSRYIYLNLLDAEDYDETNDILTNIKMAYPEARIISKVDSELEKEALLNSINVSVVSIAFIVFVICIFININIVKSKYVMQKRLWGVLRAVGIQKKKVIMNHIFETSMINLCAIVLNVIIIFLISILPIRKDYPFFSLPLLCAYIISFLFTVLSTLPIVINMFKNRIIEQIEYIE